MSERAPRLIRDAIAMWDAGEPVPVFEVESEVHEQETLWGAAFDRLAKRESVAPAEPFTKREREVIDSIVFVSEKIGFGEMVRRHIHEKSPALEIRRPGPNAQKAAKPEALHPDDPDAR
jgi:hypothetical protein